MTDFQRWTLAIVWLMVAPLFNSIEYLLSVKRELAMGDTPSRGTYAVAGLVDFIVIIVVLWFIMHAGK